MGKIVLLMGASASGKDTIYRKLVKENKFALNEIKMHTTRPPRAGEQNGREYYFCTEEEMYQLDSDKKIIELRKYNTQYGPWYYFTTSTHIDLNKNNYIASNTLVGFDQYLKYYNPEDFVSLYIQTEDGLRLTRALEREMREKNPRYTEMCRRFLADSEDFSLENLKKRPITSIIENNGTLEETMDKVNKVLTLHL